MIRLSRKAVLCRPHELATQMSELLVLTDVACDYGRARIVAASLSTHLLATPAPPTLLPLPHFVPLRWGASLLPLEFALRQARLAAAERDWAG